MNEKKTERLKSAFAGAVSGIMNGLFGSGGGAVAVPLLERTGLEPRKSHATSVALIFFLSISAAIGYFLGGNLNAGLVFPLLPGGFFGAVLGSILLKKIDNGLLRRIFGVLLIIAAGRMLLK